MSLQDMTLADFNALCTKAEGRDKLARLFQYAARAFVGTTSFVRPTAGTQLSKAEGHARTVMVQLAGARRTHRWCKEIPVIQAIPKSLEIKDPFDRILDLLQKVSLATFMMIDHWGHLKQWKILPGGKRSGAGTIQLGLKFFCFSNFMGLIGQVKKLVQLSRREGDTSTERRKCLETGIKHLLLMVQTAHLSLWYQTHDFVVGLAGIITSGMDLKAQLPDKKPAASVERKDK